MSAAEKPCELRSKNGGMVFRGAPDALARVEAFAAKEGATLQRCGEGRSRLLVLQTTTDAEVGPAKKVLRAYSRGKFRGVKAGMMEARRD